jgi:hypothetical protein
MVYREGSSNDLRHAILDGDSWARRLIQGDQKSQSAPALVSTGASTWSRGNSTNNLYYSFLEGDPLSALWSNGQKIAGHKSSAAPALAAINETVYMVHRGDDSANLWHSAFQNNSWTGTARIENQTTSQAPALASSQGRLQLVHLGETSRQLWHSVYDLDLKWRPNVPIEDQLSKHSAALSTFQGQAIMVFLGGSSEFWFTQHTR